MEACEKAIELIRETLTQFGFPTSPPSKEKEPPVEHDNTSAITTSVADEENIATGTSSKVKLFIDLLNDNAINIRVQSHES